MSEVKVGDTATVWGGTEYRVLAIQGEYVWVDSDDAGPHTRFLKELTKVQPKWELHKKYAYDVSPGNGFEVVHIFPTTGDAVVVWHEDWWRSSVLLASQRSQYTEVKEDV